MSETELNEFVGHDVVMGHESLHSFRRTLGGDSIYSTIFRNPVDRVISYYNHAMTHFLQFNGNKLTLIKFMDNDSNYELNNLQLRYVSGKPLHESVDEDDLERAKSQLLGGELQFGIQEHLLPSIRRMDLFKKVNLDAPKKSNISTYGFTRNSISDIEKDMIIQKNSLDMKLYAFALELFQNTLQPA